MWLLVVSLWVGVSGEIEYNYPDWLGWWPQFRTPWFRSPYVTEAPARLHYFDEHTGKRLAKPVADGWNPDYIFELQTGESRKRVGLDQVSGWSGESLNIATRSKSGFTSVIKEQQITQLYCPGSRHFRHFFGPAISRETSHDENNNCIAMCYQFQDSQNGGKNYSRYELSKQEYLYECRTPLVRAKSSKLLSTTITYGPTVTLQVAKSSLTGIARSDDLVDFLVAVNVTLLPKRENVQYIKEPFTWTLPPIEETTTELGETNPSEPAYPDVCNPYFAGDPMKNVGLDRGMHKDNRRTEFESPGDVPSMAWALWMGPHARRSKTNFLKKDHDFNEGLPIASPQFKAAASIHYGATETAHWHGPHTTGYFVDDLPVIEKIGRETYIVDISSAVRRLMPLDKIEIAILSSGTIIAIDENVVFHEAMTWAYAPDIKCREASDSAACDLRNCMWCTKHATAKDFYDLLWNDQVRQNPHGRCGIPKDACYLIGGLPYKNNQLDFSQ